MNKENLGSYGESLVASHLVSQGFEILSKNYKKFFGEIDIIAQKENTVTFVEVKARCNSKISMHDLITLSKQRKIYLVAQNYIMHHNLQNKTFRFDVALVDIKKDKEPVLTYIPNAFSYSQY